jgi:hypothetical protein
MVIIAISLSAMKAAIRLLFFALFEKDILRKGWQWLLTGLRDCGCTRLQAGPRKPVVAA